MTVGNNNEETIQILKLKLLLEQETTKRILEQEKTKRIVEEEKTKQIIEQEKTKQQQLIIEKEKEILLAQETKNQINIQHKHSLSSLNNDLLLLRNYHDSYDYYVNGNIDSFDNKCLLNDSDNFIGNIEDHIHNYLNDSSLFSTISKAGIQQAFDKLMVKILELFNGSTVLKYLSTYRSNSLERFRPDCNFIYKSVNLDDKSESQCVQDFIVCLGQLKTPSTSLDNEATIGEVLQCLTNVLKVQNRRKIYGFVTNFTHMTFYCAEKKPYSTSYHYYKSQHLEMFNCLSKASSSVGTKRKLNKEAWEIFTTFLTMNPDFYQYTTLNINPLDDLRGDRYSISRKLGTGVTSMVYSLVKKQDNYLIDDVENCVIKISKRTTCSESLINELKIIEQLKQSNNQNKFDLFFENVIDSSPAGNVCLLMFFLAFLIRPVYLETN
jgi:hypothetical protein